MIGALLCLQSVTIQAADWPEYRGLNCDGISTEKLNLNWSATPPKVLWKVPANTGFSSFSVGGGKAFTQVVRDINGAPREVCVALDAATGRELWFADVAVGTGYGGGGKGDGPRSTPAVSDGNVFVLTPDLVLHALDAETGKALWSHDLIKEYAAKNIGWNSAASPVIDGDLVFVMGGGPDQSLLAFNKKSGEVVWKTGTEAITHATPVTATGIRPHRDACVADTRQCRGGKPLEHAGLQGRFHLRHVRPRKTECGSAQMRGDRHRQG